MKSLLFSAAIFLILYSCFNMEPKHPDWVPHAIFYQIFPERFYNGDASNDPTLESLAGAYPHDTSSNWQISPWTSDWYKLQPWEEENGKGFGFNVQRRRYGGDIQGIVDKLDYLKELGITAIYLNPVFYSPSLHKYDGASFHHIDPHFGPDPEGDKRIIEREDPINPESWLWTSADKLFLKLINEIHKRDMRIIIDGVFNHTGINFWAFKDILKNGPSSPYKSWYAIKSWDDSLTSENEFEYMGWNGVRELPELSENEYGLLPPIKQYIYASVKRWMDPDNDGNPADGIDGWRLDVAEKIGHNFWKEFRAVVKKINPEAYITGELFWDDWQNNILMDPAAWLKGDQFDGTMNYRWSSLMTQYFIDKKNKIKASQFVTEIQKLDTSYHPLTRYQLLNLMDSHDTDRLASNIVNPDLFYDKNIGVFDNPDYDVRKPGKNEWKILKLITIVQFTFPGPPMVYYGTEAGMWGADDPDNRKPMVWPEFDYEDEKTTFNGNRREADSVSFDQKLFDFFKKIISIRNQERALRTGSFSFLSANDEKDFIIYQRKYLADKIIIVVNNSDKTQNFSIEHGGIWKELLTSEIYSGEKALNINLRSKNALILKLEN